MTYNLATPAEIKVTQSRTAPLPWAAGEPGTMFDKPGDILWCNGVSNTPAFKHWAMKNNIPTSLCYREGNTLKVGGWNIFTFQKVPQITLQQNDNDFTELFRILDVVMPEMLPYVIRLHNPSCNKNEWIKTLIFNLFEPKLSERTVYNILYSGDMWIAAYSSSGRRMTVVFEDTNREAFFQKAKARFGWQRDEEDDN